MRYVFNRAFLLLAGALLSGCMQLQTRISDHIAGQQNIAKICANPMLAQVSIKDRYQADLADLVAFEFGLDLSGLNSEHGAILQALADIHDQMNAVYAEASPASKAAIDHITTEIRVIQESGAGIRDSVRSATKDVITQHPIGANNAYSDFEQILVKVAPHVRAKFAAMATSSAKLSVTLHSAIPTLTADPALAKVHSDRLSRDLTSLERAIKQALRKFDSLITRKKMFLASNENKQDVEDKLRVLMDDLITYEAARLLTLEISRAARSIEYKLDQVDEKTWFVVSLAGYAINDKTEKEMAKLLQETFLGKNAAIDTDLKQAFVIAACGQITADTSTAPTNTVPRRRSSSSRSTTRSSWGWVMATPRARHGERFKHVRGDVRDDDEDHPSGRPACETGNSHTPTGGRHRRGRGEEGEEHKRRPPGLSGSAREDAAMKPMPPDRWPALPLAAWRDTYVTLHMWLQVIGKLTLTTTPLVNHWWNVTLRFTARGLATQPMDVADGRTLMATFDFLSDALLLQASDGAEERIALEPKTVAQFHSEVMAALHRMGMTVRIWTTPVECEERIPFEKDLTHRSYDARWVHAFWHALESMRPVFEEFRCRFLGKCSPVHFFWGGPDLAVTRFSGRRAPPLPPDADAIEREGYSHEVISHGFWPGGGGSEAFFYAYIKPEPDGFKAARVRPAAALYDTSWGEFVLPYEVVRTSPSPEEALMEFLESTYVAGADLAGLGSRGAGALEQPRRVRPGLHPGIQPRHTHRSGRFPRGDDLGHRAIDVLVLVVRLADEEE